MGQPVHREKRCRPIFFKPALLPLLQFLPAETNLRFGCLESDLRRASGEVIYPDTRFFFPFGKYSMLVTCSAIKHSFRVIFGVSLISLVILEHGVIIRLHPPYENHSIIVEFRFLSRRSLYRF